MLHRKHWHKSLTEAAILDAVERRMMSLDNPAFCLICGSENSAEPDARNVECESCGAKQVFGADELLLEIA